VRKKFDGQGKSGFKNTASNTRICQINFLSPFAIPKGVQDDFGGRSYVEVKDDVTIFMGRIFQEVDSNSPDNKKEKKIKTPL
jgi:hypothetical protein